MAVVTEGGGVSGLCKIEKGRASFDITANKVTLQSFIIRVSLLRRSSQLFERFVAFYVTVALNDNMSEERLIGKKK